MASISHFTFTGRSGGHVLIFGVLLVSVISFLIQGCTPSTDRAASPPTPQPTVQTAVKLVTPPTQDSQINQLDQLAPPSSAAAESPGGSLKQGAITTAANGLIARQHLAVLSDQIGPRLPGSPEEAEAAAYIEAVLAEYGYAPQRQPFALTTEEGDELNSANIIAVKPGLSPREIIVGAHYDSVDDGNGADDNASGVAVMLETAKMLNDVQTPYTIRFIAFGAEEVGLNGSLFYVDQMSDADIRNTVGMINLDSLIAGDKAYVYGDAGSARSIRAWILRRAAETGFYLEGKTAEDMDEWDGTPCDCADYGPFQAAGILFAYFEATNWELGDEDGLTQAEPEFGEDGVIRHTTYDNLDYIDTTFPDRIDQHLQLFVTLLTDTLTQFKETD